MEREIRKSAAGSYYEKRDVGMFVFWLEIDNIYY